MSGWKLVEAVVDGGDKDGPQVDKKVQPQNKNGRRNSKGEGRRDKKGADAPLDSQTIEYYAHQAVQQIFYLFSEENLCMDTFLRSYMDEAGYVPLAVICSYPNVAYFNIPADLLLSTLKGVTDQAGSLLEFDEAIGTLKLREKWQMWLMPNAAGGRGLPLYSLQAAQAAQVSSSVPLTSSATTSPATSSTTESPAKSAGGRRSRSGTEELSASAPEFTPAVKPANAST